MIKHLIKNSYNEIFNRLYRITDGKIIVGGSLGLRYQKIINRDINDLDMTILASDWKLYKSKIEKAFRVYPGVKIKYGILEYDVYTCFDKETKLNEFHLFVNYSNDIFNLLGDIRVLKPEYHLVDKQMMCDSGQDSDKHMLDIVDIKKYLNEK